MGQGISAGAFRASTTSTTANITLPSNLQSTDLLILFDFAYGESIPSLVTPSGWTQIANQTSSGPSSRAATWYRVGSSALSGTSVTGMTGGTGQRKICLAFKNTAFSSVGTNTYSASSTTSTGTLSAGTSPYLAIAFVVGSGTASLTSAPASINYTPATSGNIIATYALNGGTGTYTTNDSGSITGLKLLTLNFTQTY